MAGAGIGAGRMAGDSLTGIMREGLNEPRSAPVVTGEEFGSDRSGEISG
jgi:hypothetical protein